MPTTKSAKKRHRQSLENRTRNRSVKKSIKTQYRKVMDAVVAGDAKKADDELSVAAKQLDRAATRKIIHANAAARTKSRLSAKIKKLKNK
jgi:small subunit ribosomal protein S20